MISAPHCSKHLTKHFFCFVKWDAIHSDVQFNSLTLELDAPFLGLLLTQILKKIKGLRTGSVIHVTV